MGIECRVKFENWYKSIGGNVEMLPDGSAYRVPSTETSWIAFRRAWIMQQAEVEGQRREAGRQAFNEKHDAALYAAIVTGTGALEITRNGETFRAQAVELSREIAEVVAEPDDPEVPGVDIDDAGGKWDVPAIKRRRIQDDPFSEKELEEIREQGPGMVFHESGAITFNIKVKNPTES